MSLFERIVEFIFLRNKSELKKKNTRSKLSDIKYIYQGNKLLGILVSIILFPFSLLFSFFKMIVVLVSPINYSDLRYMIKTYLSDRTNKGMSRALAKKRAKLYYELCRKGAETEKSYGPLNPDKTFYVIRPYYYISTNELLSHQQHLLLYYYITLQKISYAVNKGWIPVVDYEHYDGLLDFAEEFPVNGTKNAWEYFWKQPSEFTLDEVYKSKNVILSTRNSNDYGYIPSTVMWSPHTAYADALVKKTLKYAKYTELNDETRSYIDEKKTQLFPANKRILGVVYRSTSYGASGTTNKSHPVQPSLIDLTEKIKKAVVKHNIDFVYFSNEEEKNIQYMKEVFGDKLIYLPRKRYESWGDFSIADNTNPLYMKGERYNTNLSYLTEIVLLSKCTGIIGAMSSGTRAAIIWNKQEYEFIDVIDQGLW